MILNGGDVSNKGKPGSWWVRPARAVENPLSLLPEISVTPLPTLLTLSIPITYVLPTPDSLASPVILKRVALGSRRSAAFLVECAKRETTIESGGHSGSLPKACSVDLGGRDHSSLSRYRFVARQIRGFSFIAPTETLDTLAILKGQTAKTRITLDHEGKNTKQTQFRTTHW